MRLYLHDYSHPELTGIVDGAVLAHREMASVLLARDSVTAHDLTRGGADLGELWRRSGPDDVVYAGSGPYAYLYHLWREQHGGAFRIVREVHTALWSGWWAQEELCAPLLRDGDLVLFPSEYTRRLFVAHAPGVRADNSAVAYPMLDRLPRLPPVPVPGAGQTVRVGYLGALSTAKNVDQVLRVFTRVHHEHAGRARLVFAGKPNDARWQPEQIRADLTAAGVTADAVSSRGVLTPDRLGAFFADIDVLLFPSTASRESLGRVVVEALAHGVPVLAANVGPAVELLPAANLIPTRLATGREFGMGRIEALGQVDEDALVSVLLERRYEPAKLIATAPYEDASFFAALAGEPAPDPPVHDERIIARLRVQARTGDVDPEAAGALFTDYFARRDAAVLARIAALEKASGVARPDLRDVVNRPDRNLADYRAFPRLLDALLLPPLTYRMG